MTGLLSTIALTLAAISQTATAQSLLLSPNSLGSIAHYYFSDPFFGSSGNDQQSLYFSTPSAQFNNYNTIQVTVNAPTGQAWHVSDPSGISGARLNFSLDFGGVFGAPYATINSVNLQLNNLTGTLGSFYDNSGITSLGALGIAQYYNITGDVSFTSFTDTITYDPNSIGPVSINLFNYSTLYYNYTPGSSDPGQLLTLVPVPEPSTLALLYLGGIGGVIFFRKTNMTRSKQG